MFLFLNQNRRFDAHFSVYTEGSFLKKYVANVRVYA
jgi:hypothetical protein